MKKITVVLGTARKNNFSQKVAEIIKRKLEEKDFETLVFEMIDLTKTVR